jgi:hypothetical protein
MSWTIRIAVLAWSVMAACTGGSGQARSPEECLAHPPLDAGLPVVDVPVRFVAGGAALELGVEGTLMGTTRFQPTKARVFVSELALLDPAGQRVKAELVDASGARLAYGVALADLERPDSMTLHLRAPAGEYSGIALSLGVPGRCESGEQLNHSDASAMSAPLHVDSDMYWSWNPGYVFLKFEGQLGREGFFFHVGGDERLAKLELRQAFSVAAAGGVGPTLVADFDRLLTSPAGAPRPDVNDPRQRKVHGGEWADALVENIRGSGFLALQNASH